MKLSIKDLDKFLKNELKKEILDLYLSFNILSEADLQSIVWKYISDFVKQYDSKLEEYKVLNKPYLKGVKIHPDIVIFKKEKPWVVLELKELKDLKPHVADKERKRLLKIRNELKAKKGYLLYVARQGVAKALQGQKGQGAYFFFELPIVLGHLYKIDFIREWERRRLRWAKYDK